MTTSCKAARRLFAIAAPALLAGALTLSALCLPALAVSDDPVLKRMDAVLEENTRLKEEAWKAHRNGDGGRQAAEALAASEERLERARTESLAHVAGVSPAQVEALRKDGKSWGQAAGELGVHPGFLGVGKAPLYEPQSARKAKADEPEPAKGKAGKKGKGAKAEPAAKSGKAKDAKGKKAKGKDAPEKPKGDKAKPKEPAKAKGKASKDAPEKKARKAKKKGES